MKHLPIIFKNLPSFGNHLRLPAILNAQHRQLALQKAKENPRTTLMIVGVILILIGVAIHENSQGKTGEYVGGFGTFVFVIGVIYKDAKHFFRR